MPPERETKAKRLLTLLHQPTRPSKQVRLTPHPHNTTSRCSSLLYRTRSVYSHRRRREASMLLGARQRLARARGEASRRAAP
jgi:hypothetical protein